MAEASFSQDQFSCPVCLDVLKNPVTIPCGHSYCMNCITDCWDQEDQKLIYSCPQCRQNFTPRPALCKNVMIAEVIEKLKKTHLQTACPPQSYAGPGDVGCDVCTGRKYKAVKSCVECLNSYCQSHLDQHESFFKDKRHNLMDPTGRLQEMLCPKHNKQLEIYCRTDQQCICYPCLMDEHKIHDTVTAETERTEKQRLLEETQRTFQQGIQERQTQLQELRDAVKSHKLSAQGAVDESERIFTELIRSIERRRSEVTRLIRDQEKAVVTQAEGLLQQLEQEIDDLKRRDAELEQLSHTDDHVYFLQRVQYIAAPPESADLDSATVSSLSFQDVTKSISQLKDKLEGFCTEEIEKISNGVTCIETPTNEPKTREQFLQYSLQLTLDSNTANRFLLLFKDNSVATYTKTPHRYPAHPDRFDCCLQVLCKENVCGRGYWEVEWSGSKGVFIAVSYKSIGRKGGNSEFVFGFNNQSWGLFCSPSSYLFRHSNIETELPVSPRSSKIGVYVDHSAGTLSFYSVSNTMTLIHTFQTTFTQPLYPGFGFDLGSTVKLCHLTV